MNCLLIDLKCLFSIQDDVGRRKKMDEPTPDSKPRETQREGL